MLRAALLASGPTQARTEADKTTGAGATSVQGGTGQMSKHPVGFIGLGVMGLPMARHLAAAGYPLTAYDIDPQALDRLDRSSTGTVTAASPKQVAASSAFVITTLSSGREVASVVFWASGPGRGLPPRQTAPMKHT